MNPLGFWQKYLVVLLVVAFSLVGLGFWIFLDSDKVRYAKYRNDAMVFAARIISLDSESSNRFQSFLDLTSDLEVYMFDFWIVSATGEVVAHASDKPFELDWSTLPKPSATYKLLEHINPGPFFGRGLVGLIKLNDKPEYLVFSEKKNVYSPIRKFRRASVLATFLIVLASILAAGCLGVLYLQSKAKSAIVVLNKLQQGHLEARLPADQFDKGNGLVASFNAMADEIERLVKRIRHIESSRRELMEELTHDLLTPLTSIGIVFESALQGKASRPLSAVEKAELDLLAVGHQEAKYLHQLIDDLMLLAAVAEPRYDHKVEKVRLDEILESECQSFSALLQQRGDQTKIDVCALAPAVVLGNPSMLTRMIRNALENAIAHARNQVRIEITSESTNTLVCRFTDDGPGFSEEDFIRFGLRSVQRRAPDSQKRGITIGLGSAIMKSVCEAHGGIFTFRNLIDPQGLVAGAEVVFEFQGASLQG